MEGSPNTPYRASGGNLKSRIIQDLHQRTAYSSQPSNSKSALHSNMPKSKKLNVGIVGAGFAGLRCADVLLQHGVNVTILEARNRLGGRVGQSWHLGHPVDLYVDGSLRCTISGGNER